MAVEVIKVDDSKVVIGLSRFSLSLKQNEELMNQIGASQLLSVRRTFREQGVPAGSWVPLAASTVRSNPKIYGAGHKLLIRSGRLLNSINAQVRPGMVVIGTNLVYAAVHQFGSRDRSVGIGPKSEAEAGTTVNVKAHSYSRLSSELGVGRLSGRGRRRIQGPRSAQQIGVRAHTRHQNIPPRPYLVFRPEDPQRIRGIVTRYIAQAKQKAGLGGAQ
jgi:phage gpG-like protein